MQNSQDDIEMLEKTGWIEMISEGPWCWRQPKTGGLFRFRDAVDVQRALNKAKGEKKI